MTEPMPSEELVNPNIMRSLIRVLVTLCAALGLSLTFTSAAQAATSNPVSVCGSGYYVQSSKGIGVYFEGSGPQAVAYLLYNASTGYNCAVTVVVGDRSGVNVGAGIRTQDGSWVKDTGNYTSYAGPVRVKASGKCVQYWGTTNWWTVNTRYTDTYTSPLGWCG
ncbi:serine/threonine protein kinase [Streptomyces sp. NPDC007107]|uniref:serine/threonine protein kinase n=1 Tax=Streptomyces sp. NPDC007107 TaxID=3156915 RepID=UPI0033D718E6